MPDDAVTSEQRRERLKPGEWRLPRVCQWCGAQYVSRYRKVKHCSHKCSSAHEGARRRQETFGEAIARFWSKVEKTDSCWLWTGTDTGQGYGRFSLKHRGLQAHRFAYELTKGPIPVGLTIDHLCRNRACVNPDHLEAVPNRINVLRGVGLSAINARKTHCIHGHPFDETSTRVGSRGRRCRTCEAARRQGSAV